jgi:protein-S-isoprenylcysteine O-methyltransferase Ste14
MAIVTHPKKEFTILISQSITTFAVAFFVGTMLDIAFPMTSFPYIVTELAGPFLFVTGSFLIVWASRLQNAIRKRIKKGSLVTLRDIATGPYTITRNPVYLGIFLMQLGYGFATDNHFVAIMALAALLFIETNIIHREEALFSDQLQDTYTTYKKTVRRWM